MSVLDKDERLQQKNFTLTKKINLSLELAVDYTNCFLII